MAKKFIIPFESGVVVIKHWRINNYLRNDRYHETTYLDEKRMLEIDKNGAYTMVGIPNSGIPTYGIPSIDKNSIDKDSIEEVSKGESEGETRPADANPRRFVKPSIDEVRAYCQERGNKVNPEKFHAYYESNGWSVGRRPMKDWKAAIRYWETDEKKAKSFSRPGSFFAPTGYEDDYARINAGALNPIEEIPEADEEDLKALGIGSAL